RAGDRQSSQRCDRAELRRLSRRTSLPGHGVSRRPGLAQHDPPGEGDRPLKACDLLRQTCEGLDEAHAGGLVHRDLQPSNVKIVKDHRGRPWGKILDLGLAKIGGGQTDLKSIIVDTTGLLIGTPAYMSPEQVAGATVDGRADIYSLGVVFFEM